MHPNVKDITGKRFGRLTVSRHSGTDTNREALWECICDCGNVKNIRASHLNGRKTISCGCYQKEGTSQRMMGRVSPTRKPPGVAAFNRLIGNYRRVAAYRGHEWQLDRDECLSLFRSDCHYCGCAPSNEIIATGLKNAKHGGSFRYNGIDRKDNSLGYITANVVPCCAACNYAKKSTGYEEFLNWLSRICEHRARIKERIAE